MPLIVAVSGFKNSGKTTLCQNLIQKLRLAGIKGGYIKHTSENVLLSPSNTDTGRLLADETNAVYWGRDGVRVESGMTFDMDNLAFLVSHCFPNADIVLLEGGKNLALPKIWVRSKDEKEASYPGIFMIYDRFSRGDGNETFGSGDEELMAEKLSSLACGAAYRSADVYIGRQQLPMKDFVADFLCGGIMGMLSSLKGWKNTGDPVSIYLNGRKNRQ